MTNAARKIHMIPVHHLVLDETYQPRERTSESHVRSLMAADLESGTPLLVAPNGDGTSTVIDGNHRTRAAIRLGIDALPCIIDPTAGYPEAFAANLHHGLPLTIAERRAFARWLHEREPELSLRELGRRAGLHHETVKRALEEDKEPTGDRRHSRPDPIRQLVRQVDRAYRDGHGRTWLGFGAGGSARAFRQQIEAYADADQPEVAQALLAFGHACVEAAQPFLTGEGE